jgi:hypothetical protein
MGRRMRTPTQCRDPIAIGPTKYDTTLGRMQVVRNGVASCHTQQKNNMTPVQQHNNNTHATCGCRQVGGPTQCVTTTTTTATVDVN